MDSGQPSNLQQLRHDIDINVPGPTSCITPGNCLRIASTITKYCLKYVSNTAFYVIKLESTLNILKIIKDY